MAEPITQGKYKTYLGDTVYADLDEGGRGGVVKLTPENGIEALNVIYLDGVLLETLIEWYKRLPRG